MEQLVPIAFGVVVGGIIVLMVSLARIERKVNLLLEAAYHLLQGHSPETPTKTGTDSQEM